MRKKKILITGSNGFLGTAIIKSIDTKQYNIHTFSRKKNIKSNNIQHILDLNEHKKVKNLINKIKPNYLIHLAWFSDHNQYWNSEKNVLSLNDSINLYESFCENK